MKLWRRRRWKSDQDALRGGDSIERASNWARHIWERDFSKQEVGRVVVICETIDTRGIHGVFYASDDVDMSPVLLYGLLGSATKLVEVVSFERNIERIINEVVGQLSEQFRPSADQMQEMVGGLLVRLSDEQAREQ